MFQIVCDAATWIQAAYHTITAVVGAGVLGLPHAFSFLGWGVGLLVLATAGLSALFTARLLAIMHESGGVRHNRCVEFVILYQGLTLFWNLPYCWVMQVS